MESGDTEFEVAEYCGRLSCHKPIVQPSGRGRRREFCSETCRRGADREYKRARALVEHFERYLRKTRHEVAAYGRRAEDDDGFHTPVEETEAYASALAGLSRAEGIIEFAQDDLEDPYLAELRRLVQAVSPALGSTRMRATA